MKGEKKSLSRSRRDANRAVSREATRRRQVPTGNRATRRHAARAERNRLTKRPAVLVRRDNRAANKRARASRRRNRP